MKVLASMFFSMPVCRKPTSGMQLTMRSPSSSSSSRSTPCVLGCCGPMLSSIVSPCRARSETRCFNSSTVISRVEVGIAVRSLASVGFAPVDLVEVEGELHFFVAQGMVLAQRVSDPVVGHQNPAQVGMAAEGDAEHVIHLPLVPVGGRVDGFQAIDFRGRARKPHLE